MKITTEEIAVTVAFALWIALVCVTGYLTRFSHLLSGKAIYSNRIEISDSGNLIVRNCVFQVNSIEVRDSKEFLIQGNSFDFGKSPAKVTITEKEKKILEVKGVKP